MRQIINHEHLRVYRIVTRYIELVTVWRLLLLVDDMLTGRYFRQLEYLQVVFLLDFHRQNHVLHQVGQPRWNLSHHAARQEFLIVEHFRFLLFDKK